MRKQIIAEIKKIVKPVGTIADRLFYYKIWGYRLFNKKIDNALYIVKEFLNKKIVEPQTTLNTTGALVQYCELRRT